MRPSEFRDQVTKDLLQYKNKISPYEGLNLCGRIKQTFLRGQQVYDYLGGFDTPLGQLL